MVESYLFETMSVDQLINFFNRGDDDAATFKAIEVDPGESLADRATKWSRRPSSIIERPRRRSLTSSGSNRVSSLAVALEAKPRCWER